MSETQITPSHPDQELATLIRELLETAALLPADSPFRGTPKSLLWDDHLPMDPADRGAYDERMEVLRLRVYVTPVKLSATGAPTPVARAKYVAPVYLDPRGGIWMRSAQRGPDANPEWMLARWNGGSDTMKLSLEDLKHGLREGRRVMLEDIAAAQPVRSIRGPRL